MFGKFPQMFGKYPQMRNFYLVTRHDYLIDLKSIIPGNDIDFHSPRLTWLQPLLNAQAASSRD